MKEKILPYGRRAELLRLLAQHGPLSIRSLKKIIYPPMEPRRIRESIGRLYTRGLVTKHCDGVLGRVLPFYQISREPSKVEAISRILNVSPESLERLYPRSQELLHWEECAVWAEYLKALFPELKVYREFEFKLEPMIQRMLLISHGDDEFKPDIMLIGKSKVEGHHFRVAVEIERKRKSEVRLFRKLLKYSSATIMDGVIYVCEADELAHHIQLIYRNKVLDKAPRIGHYGKNFLLFATPLMSAGGSPQLRINADLKRISLQRWMQHLIHNVDGRRRDETFNLQPEAAEGSNSGKEAQK